MTADAYHHAEERTRATAAEGDVSQEARSSEERNRTHKERFRASLAWALDEYSSTLEKLAQ